MSREELVPLPFSGRLLINWEDKSKTTTLYTADQMREYALANLQAAKPADVLGSLPVVGYGFPNTAVTGHHQPLMMIRHDIPANDQYDGKLWEPLTLHAQATAELAKRDEIIERYSMCIRENQAEIADLRAKLEAADGLVEVLIECRNEYVSARGNYLLLNQLISGDYPRRMEAKNHAANLDAKINNLNAALTRYQSAQKEPAL